MKIAFYCYASARSAGALYYLLPSFQHHELSRIKIMQDVQDRGHRVEVEATERALDFYAPVPPVLMTKSIVLRS